MKTKLLTIILLLCSFSIFAQNYEQRGDSLFAIGQYEKAIKQYNAAIAILGESASLKQKQDNCKKCINILSKAQSLEQSAKTPSEYRVVSQLYLEIYSINRLETYNQKSFFFHNRAQQKGQLVEHNEHRNQQSIGGKWLNLNAISNDLKKYKFSKMRVTFENSSVAAYSYVVIKYADTNKVALEFSFKQGSRGAYLINRERMSKQLISQGKNIKGNTYEYDMNSLCNTNNKFFYVSSWQENFIPKQVEIYVENK